MYFAEGKASLDDLDVQELVMETKKTLASTRPFRDWDRQFEIWIPRAAVDIDELLLDTVAFSDYYTGFEDCWRLIGTAGLLEIVQGRAGKSVIGRVLVMLPNPTIARDLEELQIEVSLRHSSFWIQG